MTLKSLAEIAFDAYQCFAPYAKWAKHWNELTDTERQVWERVVGRMQAEMVLRQEDDQ